MKYDDLYNEFKEKNPEGINFFEIKEKDYLVDETDGIHIIFGMVIVPYILDIKVMQKRCKKHKVLMLPSDMLIL